MIALEVSCMLGGGVWREARLLPAEVVYARALRRLENCVAAYILDVVVLDYESTTARTALKTVRAKLMPQRL